MYHFNFDQNLIWFTIDFTLSICVFGNRYLLSILIWFSNRNFCDPFDGVLRWMWKVIHSNLYITFIDSKGTTKMRMNCPLLWSKCVCWWSVIVIDSFQIRHKMENWKKKTIEHQSIDWLIKIDWFSLMLSLLTVYNNSLHIQFSFENSVRFCSSQFAVRCSLIADRNEHNICFA